MECGSSVSAAGGGGDCAAGGRGGGAAGGGTAVGPAASNHKAVEITECMGHLESIGRANRKSRADAVTGAYLQVYACKEPSGGRYVRGDSARGRGAFEGPADHLVQEARADVGVP